MKSAEQLIEEASKTLVALGLNPEKPEDWHTAVALIEECERKIGLSR